MTRALPSARHIRLFGIPVLVAALLFLLPQAVDALDGPVVSVSDLLEDGEAYNNTPITVEGELVGDYGFRRDGFMWTQLNDDSYARDALVNGGPRTGANTGIGVRMPSALGVDLDPVGGYRLEGPLVQLGGIWRYHDPDRGGETYLDVEDLVVIEGGRRLEEGPDWSVFAFGVVLIGTSIALWYRRRRAADG